MSDAEARRLGARIADLKSLIAGQRSNAEDQDRRARLLADDARSQKDRGRYVEGTDLERQAEELRRSAENTRRNMWRLENELKGLERQLSSMRR